MNLKVQGIYMILNIVNNKMYIGSSKNIKGRKEQHIRELRNNKHGNNHLQKAWDKYGEDKFVFIKLEEVENIDIMYEREIAWIEFKKTLNPQFGYNLGIPTKYDNCSLRKETIDKLLISTYKQFYKENDNISLEEFINGKRRKHLKLKGREHLKKKILLFDKLTGEKKLELNGISETAKYFNKDYKSIFQFIDSTKTFRGYFLVREENYSPEKEYKLKSKVEKVTKERVPFKGNPVECTNIETGEVKMYSNKNEAADDLGTQTRYIDKVIYGQRNHHKGCTFRLIKK